MANKDVETIIEADPVDPNRGSSRVYRGGTWTNGDPDLQVSASWQARTVGPEHYMGFRLALCPTAESGVKVAKPAALSLLA